MSFSIILLFIAIGGGLTYLFLGNQKNKTGNQISEATEAKPELEKEPVTEQIPLETPTVQTAIAQTDNEIEANDSSQLSEDEMWLLKQFLCFPAEYHSIANVREVLSIGTADAPWLDSIIASLVKKGWLSEPPHAQVYKLNSTGIEAALESDPPVAEDVSTYAENVANNLHIEKSIYEGVPDYPWVPFGKAILAKFGNEDDESIALLQNEMGMVMNETGDFKSAKFHYAKALSFYEKELGTDHENTAVLYLNSANVSKQLGDYAQAKALLEKALNSYEKNLGVLHPDTAMIYSYLAVVLQEMEDCENAQKVLEKLLNADKHNFGEKHQNTATCYSDLANVCYDCENYEDALKYASHTIEILRSLHPEGHQDIDSMQNGVSMIKERMAAKAAVVG